MLKFPSAQPELSSKTSLVFLPLLIWPLCVTLCPALVVIPKRLTLSALLILLLITQSRSMLLVLSTPLSSTRDSNSSAIVRDSSSLNGAPKLSTTSRLSPQAQVSFIRSTSSTSLALSSTKTTCSIPTQSLELTPTLL